MVIVKLQGGLGNQMFQYAAARHLSPNKPVLIDLSFLKKQNRSTTEFTARSFELGIFKQLCYRPLNPITSTLINVNGHLRRLITKTLFPNLKVVSDSDDPITINDSTLYLDGYFQNEKYFTGSRTRLLQELNFPALAGDALQWQQRIKNSINPVSIHVRRQDYLKPAALDYHGVLPIDYYKQACAAISQKVPNVEYFVFSDDQPWCREAFGSLGGNYSFVNNNQANWMDMALTSQCKHHIIANSSFSWWAAWLNQYPSKNVIAPKQWFANGADFSIPDTWITV